eukprot:6754081-Karenia_brevis.AAC.1
MGRRKGKRFGRTPDGHGVGSAGFDAITSHAGSGPTRDRLGGGEESAGICANPENHGNLGSTAEKGLPWPICSHETGANNTTKQDAISISNQTQAIEKGYAKGHEENATAHQTRAMEEVSCYAMDSDDDPIA